LSYTYNLKKKYNESQKVKDAFEKYNTYKNTQKPKDYAFSDSDLLSQTQDKYFNADDFSYDVSKDPAYIQYKQLYQSNGKKAMEDFMGNASFLTGGYGNSYALTAGMNSYNEYMDKLNNVIPELYSAAYSRYESELDRLENKLGYLANKDKNEYGKYLDEYNIYSNEVDSLRDLYLSEYENDINIQDSEWEAAYKLAMAEQDKAMSDAELAYKYYASEQNKANSDAELAYKYYTANLDKEMFDKDLEYKKQSDATDNFYRFFDLLHDASKNSQSWAEFNEKNRETLREDEIYVILGKQGEYDALAALDMNYNSDEMVRNKALAMGIEKSYIDAYFEAKKSKK